MGITGVFGRPGYRTTAFFTHKYIFRNGSVGFWPGGGTIDTAKTRDVLASSDNTYFLRPGVPMGKITSTGYWANSIIGITTGALANGGTSITVSAAQATELVRRIGSSGTLTLTGPPTAAGTVRSVTVTYSAVDTTTGVITITAIGVNEVQLITFDAAATGGNLRLTVPTAAGVAVTTAAIAWNATDATYLASIQSALDTATGVVSGIVASGLPDTALTLTYSGTGYAGTPQPFKASVATFPTSSAAANVTTTTAGVEGRMIAGAIVGPTDGSQTPKSFIDGGYGLTLFTDPNQAPATSEWPQIPIFGIVETGQLPYYPSDASLKAWLRNSLSTTAGAKFTFSDQL